MLNAIFKLATQFAPTLSFLWCDLLKLSLCPSCSCANVSHNGSVIGGAFLDGSMQHLVIQLLSVLGVASLCVVLFVSGSLADGISE